MKKVLLLFVMMLALLLGACTGSDPDNSNIDIGSNNQHTDADNNENADVQNDENTDDDNNDQNASTQPVSVDELVAAFQNAGYDMEYSDEYEGAGSGDLRTGVTKVDAWYAVGLSLDSGTNSTSEMVYFLYVTCESISAAKTLYTADTFEAPGVHEYSISEENYQKTAITNYDNEENPYTGIYVQIDNILLMVTTYSVGEDNHHFHRVEQVLESLGY